MSSCSSAYHRKRGHMFFLEHDVYDILESDSSHLHSFDYSRLIRVFFLRCHSDICVLPSASSPNDRYSIVLCVVVFTQQVFYCFSHHSHVHCHVYTYQLLQLISII